MSDDITRARLLSLLSEACELEHALCCSYLYAAFSVRKELDEGIDWEQQQWLRRWASQVFHVAAEEMLHLAQAWNLLTAVGGSPYYARPNFPQPAKHFPLNVPLVLRRLDAATAENFVYYESPAHERDDLPDLPAPSGVLWPIDESFPFHSVGRLYGECQRIIENIDERDLFIGPHDHQIGSGLIDFPDIVEVVDRESAVAAIELITEQGEGTQEGREDSHYGVFVGIRDKLRGLPDDFAAARPVADNPYVRRRRDQIATGAVPAFQESGIRVTELTDRTAILAVDLFDDIYVSMLQALAYVFSNATQDEAYLRMFAQSALDMMMTVIRPLGEAICLLPSGQPGINAGPTFAMTRHAQLPAPAPVAQRVFGERVEQLHRHAELLATSAEGELSPFVRAQLGSVSLNLARIAEQIANPATTSG